MPVVLVTGSCGLIGSETVSFFAEKGFDIVGVDNNMRKFFFGEDGSVIWNKNRIKKNYKNYIHYDIDIRDEKRINNLFKKFAKEIVLVVHTAAQPSHDWAARSPKIDFAVNASGTLNLLEAVRNGPENEWSSLT